MTITTTLGKAGRLVVPKPIRESLGLREGSRLRLEASAGKFEAIPEADDVQIQIRNGLPVITGGAPRGKGDIVRAIKAGREERTDRIVARRKKK
jgi:AbrB family looped-hinge helix DNA binding protein